MACKLAWMLMDVLVTVGVGSIVAVLLYQWKIVRKHKLDTIVKFKNSYLAALGEASVVFSHCKPAMTAILRVWVAMQSGITQEVKDTYLRQAVEAMCDSARVKYDILPVLARFPPDDKKISIVLGGPPEAIENLEYVLGREAAQQAKGSAPKVEES